MLIWGKRSRKTGISQCSRVGALVRVRVDEKLHPELPRPISNHGELPQVFNSPRNPYGKQYENNRSKAD